MTGLWPAGWDAVHPAGAAPVMLTVALPLALQQALDALRGRLNPDAARHAPAHLGLFRHLPGPGIEGLLHDIRRACACEGPTLRLRPPQRWEGLWVMPVDCPALDALREDLAQLWHGLLSPGDKAPPRLHISIGRSAEPPPLTPPGPWRPRGLLVWQYDKAFWRPLVAYRFHR